MANDVLMHNQFIKRKRKEEIISEEKSDMQLVDLNTASHSLSRTLGAELVAKAVILGRLINPTSELGTWRWFQNNTSLIEMTSEDLTNTYFEGSAKNNNKAKFGRSKEKRTDCPLVTLAMVVDELGFPVLSQIYDGNKSEPETLTDILNKLQDDSNGLLDGQKPVLIMDRGIATKDNIALIKEQGYPYTVINRAQNEKKYTNEFTEIKQHMELKEGAIPKDWTTVDNSNTVYIKKILDNNIAYVLSASTGRAAKEQGMDQLNLNSR